MDAANKLILTESETLNLLSAFYKEALMFLNIPEEKHALIKNQSDATPQCINPLHIEFSTTTIYVQIQFFRFMVASNPTFGNDAPTMYRMYGYMLAYVWSEYVDNGRRLHFPMNHEAIAFANALLIVKGIPIHNRKPLPMELLRYLGFDPNDLKPSIQMLRNKFGINCIIRNAKDRVNNKIVELVSYSPNEFKKRGDKFIELYNENRTRELPSIKDGELGSISNPFANVDEAADYILKLDKERLSSDRYRTEIANEQYYYDFETNSFRISWASPHVSYYPIDNAQYPYFVVNQLSQVRIAQPPRFSIKPSLRNNKFLYRGQAEFYSPCKPSLFRDRNKQYFVDDLIQLDEMEVLLQDHPLVKLFEQGFMLMHEYIQFKINYSGLSQHYYNKTHMFYKNAKESRHTPGFFLYFLIFLFSS